MLRRLSVALTLVVGLCAGPALAQEGLDLLGVDNGSSLASFTTLDPVTAPITINLTNGNLTIQSTSGNGAARTIATLPPGGKVHVEFTVVTTTGGFNYCVANASHPLSGASSWCGSDTNSVGYDKSTQSLYAGASGPSPSNPFNIVTGDTVAVEVDVGAGTIVVQKAGTGVWTSALCFIGTACTINNAVTGPYYLAMEMDDTTSQVTWNFGASAFAVTPSSGYSGLH